MAGSWNTTTNSQAGGEIFYFDIMNFEIRCCSSAFKHGVTKADILWAFNTVEYDAVLEEYVDKYLLIGFDKNANLIEIIYSVIEDNAILVFHAMKCRPAFISLLK